MNSRKEHCARLRNFLHSILSSYVKRKPFIHIPLRNYYRDRKSVLRYSQLGKFIGSIIRSRVIKKLSHVKTNYSSIRDRLLLYQGPYNIKGHNMLTYFASLRTQWGRTMRFVIYCEPMYTYSYTLWKNTSSNQHDKCGRYYPSHSVKR